MPPLDIEVSSDGQFVMIPRKSPENLLRARVACFLFLLVGSERGPFTLSSRICDAQVLLGRPCSASFMIVDNLTGVMFHLTPTCCCEISSRSLSSRASSFLLSVELIRPKDEALG